MTEVVFARVVVDWCASRPLASDTSGRRGIHSADDRSQPRCGTDPRPTDGGARARGVVGLAPGNGH